MPTPNFTGIIIAESLSNKSILDEIKITGTEVEPVTDRHQTPWIKQWTMHSVLIDAGQAGEVAEKISRALDREHDWYADFKNDKEHYIIYRDKVFHITDRSDKLQYDEATKYGISVGIPDYQVDFSGDVTVRGR